jgi:hypothetical protein
VAAATAVAAATSTATAAMPEEEEAEEQQEAEEEQEEDATPSFGSTLLSRATLSNRILKRKHDFAHITIGRRSPLNSSFANVDLI